MYLPPDVPLQWLGIAERLNRYLALFYLSQLILFWLVAAGGQGMALHWLLPQGRRWGFLTFVGGMVATMGYTVAGLLLAPVWTEFLGVRVRPMETPLFFFQPNYLHQTLFLAVLGAVFGGLLAFLQAAALPFGWRRRPYLRGIGFCRSCPVGSCMACRRLGDDDIDPLVFGNPVSCRRLVRSRPAPLMDSLQRTHRYGAALRDQPVAALRTGCNHLLVRLGAAAYWKSVPDPVFSVFCVLRMTAARLQSKREIISGVTCRNSIPAQE